MNDNNKTSSVQPRRALLLSILAAVPACALAVMLVHAAKLGPIDDAYISLRYATHWAGGDGLSFNPGECVEGYTNFLVVAIEATAIRFGLAPSLVLRLVSWLPWLALVVTMAYSIIRYALPDRHLLGLAVAMAVGLNPMLICWGASGMETCLYAWLILLSTLLCLRRPAPWRPVAAGFVLALAGLTRPEAAGLLPALAIVVYHRGHKIRGTCVFAVTFLALFGVYFAWRAQHFGYLFPNTFYAKVDYGSLTLATRGLAYVARFAWATAPLCVLVVAAMRYLHGSPLWVRACTALVAVQLVMVVVEGGDHFAMYRFMVPTVPLLALLATYGATLHVSRRGLDRIGMRGAAGIVVAMLGLSYVTICLSPIPADPSGRTQFRGFAGECDVARDWEVVGRHLARLLPPDASICTIAIGAIGYYSDRYIVDAHGLVDPAIAHRNQPLGKGYIGHEKYDSSYVLDKQPTCILMFYLFTPQPLREDAIDKFVWDDFSKSMLQEPRFHSDYRFVPLAIDGRWFHVYVRAGSDAASLIPSRYSRSTP